MSAVPRDMPKHLNSSQANTGHHSTRLTARGIRLPMLAVGVLVCEQATSPSRVSIRRSYEL